MLLKKGDSGTNVKYLQQGLRILCCNPNGLDGVFGAGTESAVIKFQNANNLSPDGIVGDDTWNVLKEKIIPIQTALNGFGYNLGTPDGVAGSNTYNAVLAFQKANNLTADGMVGSGTKALLFPDDGTTADYVLSKGSSGSQVQAAQERLIALGYSCGSAGADGNFGNGTYTAVVAFQKANNLTMDGVIGPKTKSVLFSADAIRYTEPTVLKKGSSGSAVVQLQQKLIALGYSCGSAGADGNFGNNTYYAVIAFQKANGLTPDGIAGPATLGKLNSPDAVAYTSPTILKKGDSGQEVVKLQTRLIELGYSCGSAGADGVYGDGTYNAVVKFQTVNGLTIDGIAGSATLTLLYSDDAAKNTSEGSTTPTTVYSDLVTYAISVIVNGEGDYTAINKVDPISIGKLQWYQERAHDLLVDIYSLNQELVKTTLAGLTLLDEISEDRSVFAGRYLNSTEYDKLKVLLATQESRQVQDKMAQEDVAGYIEIGKGYGITDEKTLIYFSDLYNQSPKQAKLIVEACGGGIGLTLDSIHAGAMQNNIMNQYADRRNNAYALANAYEGTKSLEAFVNIALGELGVVEKYDNLTKYGEWYNYNGQPWCAMFVSWCANEAGILYTSANTNGLVPKYCSVYLGMVWYQNQNRFGAKGSYDPKFGDVLFLKSSGASHTAIVVGYEKSSNTLCTIEGNFSNKVCVVLRYANDTRITGYGINGSNSNGYIAENATWDKGSTSTI